MSDGDHDRDTFTNIEEDDERERLREDGSANHVEERPTTLHGKQAVLWELVGSFTNACEDLPQHLIEAGGSTGAAHATNRTAALVARFGMNAEKDHSSSFAKSSSSVSSCTSPRSIWVRRRESSSFHATVHAVSSSPTAGVPSS